MTAKPEAPEALFGGVDWDHVHRNILEDRWAVVLHQVEYCIARDHDTGEWSGSFLSLSGENDRTVGNREQVLAWLRTKVIEARDELCRVTGTVAVQGWQPIGTAPKDGTRILVLDKSGLILIAINTNLYGFVGCTHWMPLPSVPEVE